MIQQVEEETGQPEANLPRSVAPEVASANPDVIAIITPRLTMLMEIANSFLLTIMESIESVPYGIRWICKQIRSLTRVSCTILGCGSPAFAEYIWFTGTTAQVPRRVGRRDLLAHRRLLLPSIHQSCDCHTTGLYARRWSPREIPSTNTDPGLSAILFISLFKCCLRNVTDERIS